MTARERMLGRIRERLARGDEGGAVADERLRERPAGPLPERAREEAATAVERFVARAEAASARVERVDGLETLPSVVAEVLQRHGFDGPTGVAPDPRLMDLDWSGADCTVAFRRGQADDRVGVGHALCGVAETGTLVLASGRQSPTTLGFLPDVHVVALDVATIVGGYEAAWSRVRARGPMPRAVNWITGPSRSADIEQTLQLGAHGPVELVIALYGEVSVADG